MCNVSGRHRPCPAANCSQGPLVPASARSHTQSIWAGVQQGLREPCWLAEVVLTLWQEVSYPTGGVASPSPILVSPPLV